MLRPYLEEVFELTPEGSQYVFPEARCKRAVGPDGERAVNLRTMFEKIIARAGLRP
jgi:hypothetical protein